MRAQKVKINCLSCGKEMLIAPSRISEGRGKYCSRECAKDGYHKTANRPATRKDGFHRFEYQKVAEKALGRPLSKGEVVHHIDLNPQNNDNSNLVICSQPYHLILHARQRAMNATGNPDAKKCVYCKQWDTPENMVIHKVGTSNMRHRSCFYRKVVA